jgi:hypothetical protein
MVSLMGCKAPAAFNSLRPSILAVQNITKKTNGLKRQGSRIHCDHQFNNGATCLHQAVRRKQQHHSKRTTCCIFYLTCTKTFHLYSSTEAFASTRQHGVSDLGCMCMRKICTDSWKWQQQPGRYLQDSGGSHQVCGLLQSFGASPQGLPCGQCSPGHCEVHLR